MPPQQSDQGDFIGKRNSQDKDMSSHSQQNDKKTDFSTALEEVGGFGIYQKLLCVFVFFNLSFAAANYWTQIFILTTPKHWCKMDLENEQGTTCKYDVRDCFILLSKNSTHEFIEQDVLSREILEYGTMNVTQDCSQRKMSCSNGWDYDFSELYPTYTTEHNWVCGESWRTYVVHMAFWIGSALGFLVWGLMADRFGRRQTLYMIYFLNIVSTIGTVLFSNGIVFTVIRFCVGFTMCPAASLAYTLSVEYVSPSKRSFIGAVVCFGWMSGFAGSPWMAYFLGNWKLVVICPIIVEIGLFVFLRWVPESASWLLTCGRTEEAKIILARIAKINSSPVSLSYLEKVAVTSETLNDEVSKESFFQTTLALMKSPVLRKRTLILLTLSFFVGFYCNGNLLHVSKLNINFFLTYSIIGVMEFPSSLYSAFILDKIGRRWSCFTINLFGGLVAICLFVFPNKGETLIEVLDMIVCLSFITSYNMLFQFAVELFPTSVRARGYCLKRLFGELGGCAGSLIVYLTEIDPFLPQLVYGILCSISAFLVLFLPETTNQSLPITVAEGEKFGIDQKFTFCPIAASFRGKNKEVI